MESLVQLEEMARQIRGGTIELLSTARPAWLTWSPAGTSNHILWHAGHALWLQDALCIAKLIGNSELPDGWAETFGMRCRPVANTTDWPDPAELGQLLEEQLQRMLELFRGHAGQQLLSGGDKSWQLVRGIIHGLHDEARHQGEMYLLTKMCQAVATTNSAEVSP